MFIGGKEYIKVKDGIAIINNKIQGNIVQITSKTELCFVLNGSLVFLFSKKKLIFTKNQKTKTDKIIK